MYEKLSTYQILNLVACNQDNTSFESARQLLMRELTRRALADPIVQNLMQLSSVEGTDKVSFIVEEGGYEAEVAKRRFNKSIDAGY